jgi:hypothetical protein
MLPKPTSDVKWSTLTGHIYCMRWIARRRTYLSKENIYFIYSACVVPLSPWKARAQALVATLYTSISCYRRQKAYSEYINIKNHENLASRDLTDKALTFLYLQRKVIINLNRLSYCRMSCFILLLIYCFCGDSQIDSQIFY